MGMPSFDTFKTTALAEGFDEVLERQWAAGTKLDTHTHDFSVKALVVQGEMWLTVNGHTLHLQDGDPFKLEKGVPHTERYGDAGATYWVARKN